jgi:DNA adenine methylase
MKHARKTRGLIRYPGSKDKIANAILRHFPQQIMNPLFQSGKAEYREPFFGSGAFGFRALPGLRSKTGVWINDKDYGMACLWKTVSEDHVRLVKLIQEFKPSTDAFYRFKEEDADIKLLMSMDIARVALQKLALHQTSFSGLGAKAGGPLGGRKQSSEYNVDCRWNADRHVEQVRQMHAILDRFREGNRLQITHLDFDRLIVDAPQHAFIYLDPPYYEKGGQLYKHNMSEDDHRRLAEVLRTCRAQWVLSYDDHEVIRSLYSWADIESVELTYTISRSREETRRKNHEIVIKPRQDSQLKVVA